MSYFNQLGSQGSFKKHALSRECSSNGLESGVYRVSLPHEDSTFTVDCLTDGTMYIAPSEQGIYQYRKQTGMKMKFKLLKAARFDSLDEIDENVLPDLNALYTDDASDEITIGDVDDEAALLKIEEKSELDLSADSRKGAHYQAEGDYIGGPIELSADAASSKEKVSVNLTAQYIVYAVIIVMALVFSMGICLLVYWWCCRDKRGERGRGGSKDMKESLLETDGAVSIKSKSSLGTIDETAPFVDIRSPNTVKRKAKTVYLGMPGMGKVKSGKGGGDGLQRERSNVYDVIDGADDDEDGDELIAHYGATTTKRRPTMQRSTI